MQSYAIGFLLAALTSACFVDGGVKVDIARLGKLSVAVFGVLFVVAEGIVLLT